MQPRFVKLLNWIKRFSNRKISIIPIGKNMPTEIENYAILKKEEKINLLIQTGISAIPYIGSPLITYYQGISSAIQFKRL
jgi:hypothetical protein